MSENVIEKALMFATIAHSGQVRKGEPDKPQIMHPMAVAQILNEYGADNNVIAAALLHDVVEDTKYKQEDITKSFGEDISHLVEVATDSDKNQTWEERKKHKIEISKKLELREKLVIIADKINNIEDMNRIFKEKGVKDFSAFRRGEEQQEWYYRNMYFSLINGENIENPLFTRLENGINNTFGRTMEEYKKIDDITR
jgi:(p)ppGpp synthase/HD superfamily hydrolase